MNKFYFSPRRNIVGVQTNISLNLTWIWRVNFELTLWTPRFLEFNFKDKDKDVGGEWEAFQVSPFSATGDTLTHPDPTKRPNRPQEGD